MTDKFTFPKLQGGERLWNFGLQPPRLGAFQHARCCQRRVVMTFIHKMEQGEKESLSRRGHGQQGAAQDRAPGRGGLGRRASPGGSGEAAEGSGASRLPGLPESRAALRALLREPGRAGRRGQRAPPPRPRSADRRQQAEGPQGSTANPPVSWRDGKESARLQPPPNVRLPRSQLPRVAATSSAASRSTQRGMGGGYYGESLGTNGFNPKAVAPRKKGWGPAA